LVNVSITKDEAKAVLALCDAFLTEARSARVDSPTRIMLPLVQSHLDSLRSKLLRSIAP